ncbi:HAD family hydrolase [Legionella cincinnatiensis]|uniref:Soluble P-type ATPase n=1 Tax=Legionella cincinnatiensis TaxID=28085 RepID=A0A378IHL7_9GAMM|nr:HAD family hydrolase [Legionella cincinnatiensis]KTC81947.1 hypothetical protein Lcin_3017 [Legionella cincinnatiensis]STX34727.1 Soluble P-type ATPase [Legionella cincinnatiensis]
MIQVKIPGFAEVTIKNVIFDYNGTLAVDGYLIEGVAPLLTELAQKVKIHIVTGDSFGTAQNETKDLPCELLITPSENQGTTKKNYLHQLNPKETVSIGNGRNDHYILKESVVGIIILGKEGASIAALNAADVVVTHIFDAIDLLQHPNRLRSTLRA